MVVPIVGSQRTGAGIWQPGCGRSGAYIGQIRTASPVDEQLREPVSYRARHPFDRRYLWTTARRIASSISSSVALRGGLPRIPARRDRLRFVDLVAIRSSASRGSRGLPGMRTLADFRFRDMLIHYGVCARTIRLHQPALLHRRLDEGGEQRM